MNPVEESGSGGRGWKFLLVLTGVLALLHILLVFRQFPLPVLLRGDPLCGDDLGIHFAGACEGSRMLQQGEFLWGYSPTYMAGYPFGVWDSFSRRGYEYVTLLFPWCSLPTAFYWYVVITALLPPFLIALAAHILKLRPASVLLSFCLSVALYQADNTVAYFWTFGNVAFPFVNALVVLYLACAWRAITACSWRFMIVAGVLLGAACWLHQLAALLAIVGSLAMVPALGKDAFRLGRMLPALAIAGIGFLLVLPWVLALLESTRFRAPRDSHALMSGWKYFVMDFFSDRAYRHHFDRRSWFHVQLVLFGIGSISVLRNKMRTMGPLAATAAGSLAFAYLFAATAALRQTEPYRFVVSFSLLGALPMTMGVEEGIRMLRKSNRQGQIVALAFALMLLPSLTAYAFDIVARRPSGSVRESQKAVVEWIKSRPLPKGRVLCDDESLADLLPYYTGVQVLGGALTRSSPLCHRQVWERGRSLLQSADQSADPSEFRRYLDEYNVACIIGRTSGLSETRLRRIGCKEVHVVKAFIIGLLDPQSLSYLEGTTGGEKAAVTAEMNEIRVKNAPAGRFVLKYHFMPSLVPPASVRLSPVLRSGDPVPFIGVDNTAGIRDITIRNRR